MFNKKILQKRLEDFVLEAGLEPAQPQWPKDFKSFVSTIPPFEQLYWAYFAILPKSDTKII